MVSNTLSLTRKTSLLYRFVGLSSKPIPHINPKCQIPLNPIQLTGLRACSTSFCYSKSLNYTRGTVSKNFTGSQMGFGQMGFRVLAVSGGEGGGVGSGNSGGGGGGGSGGDAGGGGSNWSVLSWYLGLLANYPVLTKAITSAVLTLVGDIICQLVIEQVSSLDLKRTFLFTFLGLVLVGPTLHFWYLYLSMLVTIPGASGAFLRLLLDQFLFSPTFIGVFLATLVTLEGRPHDVVPKLQQEWFSSVVANWQLWIPFQFLNFRFVPQQFQVLAANVIALVWNVILSFKAHKEILQK